jgi:hypothetical protein
MLVASRSAALLAHRVQSLSRTKAPEIRADRRLWPAWTIRIVADLARYFARPYVRKGRA